MDESTSTELCRLLAEVTRGEYMVESCVNCTCKVALDVHYSIKNPKIHTPLLSLSLFLLFWHVGLPLCAGLEKCWIYFGFHFSSNMRQRILPVLLAKRFPNVIDYSHMYDWIKNSLLFIALESLWEVLAFSGAWWIIADFHHKLDIIIWENGGAVKQRYHLQFLSNKMLVFWFTLWAFTCIWQYKEVLIKKM